jgi:hypothetical protein
MYVHKESFFIGPVVGVFFWGGGVVAWCRIANTVCLDLDIVGCDISTKCCHLKSLAHLMRVLVRWVTHEQVLWLRRGINCTVQSAY